MPPQLRDRMRGEDIGDGWVVHTRPDGKKYYYHKDLKLVTTEDMANHETRSTFLSTHRNRTEEDCSFETLVYKDKAYVVKHPMETLVCKEAYVVNHPIETLDDQDISDESRSKYWGYLSNYPCHYDLPSDAEKEALRILQLMIVQHLTNPQGMAPTPFSMADIQQYIDFFDFSKTLKDSHSDVPSAKAMIISNIIANFCASFALVSAPELHITTDGTRVQNAGPTHHAGTQEVSWLKIVIIFACWGMPPNYLQRFEAAYDMYGQTLQPDVWKSFLDVVRRERAAANVLSGLLLASSVAFLAIQNLVDFAQFFIIMSIGLSLGCVVMGFNGEVEEKLYKLQSIPPPIPSNRDKQVTEMGRALEQQYTMLLLSILFFYLALLGFTVYSIYASVFVAKSFTIPYVFYVMATGGLFITLVFILHWNSNFRNNGAALLHAV